EHRLIRPVRFATRRVENPQRRVTDNVPAARTVHGVNARVFSPDGDRTGAHLRPGRGQARRVQTRVQIAEVRKSGRKTEHGIVVKAGTNSTRPAGGWRCNSVTMPRWRANASSPTVPAKRNKRARGP